MTSKESIDTHSDAILYSSCSKESENETDDADDSNMDLSYNNPNKDDDAGFGVFMYNKSAETPKSTYLMSNPVYTDAQTTSAIIYPEGNPDLTSYISGASEVPLGTHVDVQATNILLQEMFLDVNAHHKPSLPAKKIPYNATTPQPSSLQAKAKKLMQKAKQNMRKINFKKAVAKKFREYDQMLEALTNFNLYDTLYESICLDHDALNAQDAEPSFYKRSYDNQDPPNNHEGENRKKCQKDVDEPSSRSSRQNKSLVVHAQVDTPVIQPLDQKDENVQNHPNPKWFPKKSGSTNAKRRTTWFDLLLKLDIDQNKNHILGPSTVVIAKKIKAIIQKDELTIVDLKGAGLERVKQ
ncbi:hypothetical protein Tco_0637214 [Tanacetum coccineum]